MESGEGRGQKAKSKGQNEGVAQTGRQNVMRRAWTGD
jgi:hypothetical protein